MYVDHAGHFASVIARAKIHNAMSVSIQSFFTFVNFNDEENARGFNEWCKASNMRTDGVNTVRPFVPFEVAVQHP